MEPKRWDEIERLYHAALELKEKERLTFLASACAGDEVLRREVESLLQSDAQAGSFIESPAIEVAARSLAGDERLTRSLASSPLEPGATVSHYKLISRLGAGGMGEVYRARDTMLGRDVALKFPPEDFSLDQEKLERFRREAWAASALNHPNICTIYEIGEHKGRLFIAMELIEGKTLAEILKQGPLPIDDVLANARQIAEALEEAHEHNIVHRDLKPANVMVTIKGRVKILDFGLAKLEGPRNPAEPSEQNLLQTQVGAIMGTLPYMAPEQLRGETTDARTDLYALGELIYEMATGQRPFPETQTKQLMEAKLNQLPRRPRELNPQIPEKLEAAILKTMAKDPSERYQSAAEILVDLWPQNVTTSGTTGLRGTPNRIAILGLTAGIAVALLASLLLVPSVRRLLRITPSAGVAALGQRQLAVLPFSAVSGGPKDDAFSRGLAETLAAKLTQLSRGHSLQVVPVGDLSAQHITTAKQAAKIFGVNLVLTGSLERFGDLIRVSYALVDPSSDRQISAQTLTLPDSDPFDIQDRVVEGSAAMLSLPLREGQRRQVESHGTRNATAFNDYLEGLGYLQNYEKAENIDNAIGSFQTALNIDASYALAYAGLGQAYWSKYMATKDSVWVDQARGSCSHAVTLDPKLPASHLCLGILENGTGQYEDAIREFQSVLQSDPTNTSAYEGLATAQYRLKRIKEAEATYQRAIKAAPHYWSPYNWLGTFYFAIGDNEKAAEMFKKVVELAPGNHLGYYNLCAAEYLLGSFAQAEATCRKSIAIRPSSTAYSNLGTVLFCEGQYKESAEWFEKAVQLRSKDPELWGNLGDAYKWSPSEGAKAVAAYRKAAELAREGLRVNPKSYQLLGALAMYEAETSNIAQAMRDLHRALLLAPKDFQIMYDAAVVFQLAGRRAQALHYLERARNGGYPVQSIRTDPNWKSLQNDPAFQKLINSRNQ
jgi:serine/threonine protein kinase/tetratricopeptide (TPR) repeat protein